VALSRRGHSGFRLEEEILMRVVPWQTSCDEKALAIVSQKKHYDEENGPAT